MDNVVVVVVMMMTCKEAVLPEIKLVIIRPKRLQLKFSSGTGAVTN